MLLTAEQRPAPFKPPCRGDDGPAVVYAWNIWNAGERIAFRSRSGWSIRQLAPKTTLPVLCFFNGEPALPEDWDYVPRADDHILFQTLPAGPLLPYIWYIVAALAVVAAYMLAPSPPSQQGAVQEASPTYAFNVSGNQARLGQSIPVPYGRHVMMPDFAASPYVEYDANGDQFYHALFCLGMVDKFTLEQIAIDDTLLEHFTSVQTQLIGPQHASTLTLIEPAVVSSPEVANNDLLYGATVGPFTVCGPGLEVDAIGIDVSLPRGLYYAQNDGSLSPLSISWLVEARTVTASGAASGNWTLLGVESLTDNTSDPIYRSYKYNVTIGRYQVRARRETVRDDNTRAGNDIQWHGMRGYLTLNPALEPRATFLAIRAKATSQLSSNSERRFTVILRRWLAPWSPGGGWATEAETQSIAWALADVLKNTDYGAGLPDSRIDLQTLYDLNAIWTARGDTFNGVFDKRVTIWGALQTIARAGRARPVMRGNVVTFVRDDQQTLPVALFNMRNIEHGSFSIEYTFVPEDSTDGVELEFFDENKWASDWVTLPLPGVVGDPIDPMRLRVMGITNRNHALRECAYTAADQVYRKVGVQFVTEMEGLMVSYGDLIAVSHDIASWGVSGDVENWDGTTATCSEELLWTVGDHYAVITDAQGDLYGPYRVEPGDGPRTMRFVQAPAFTPYTGTERDRTRFSMGPASNYARLCKVVHMDPRADGKVQIRAIVEDARVHAADLNYVGGSTGGGAGRVARYAPDGVPNYMAASDAQRVAYGFFSDDSGLLSNNDAGYTYGP